MNIFSDPNNDVRNHRHIRGGYEWWYFDGISTDGKYSFVVIFYEGNPFSTRYNSQLLDDKNDPGPTNFPAISISIYENSKTIYYSFTEFEPSDCSFSEDRPMLQIGGHRLKGRIDEHTISYSIDLNETLPSGDSINAQILYEGPQVHSELFNQHKQNSEHCWNLVQPRAEIEGKIQLRSEKEVSKEISFQGRGYHDQNTGLEPMYDEFSDWYWGRFHFEYATLVYYAINRQNKEQHQAWLISNDNSKILEIFDEIDLADKGLSLFGLKTARKVGLRSDNAEVQIQQNQLLDNGPFYQRFHSDAFLRIPGEHVIESQGGICEYLRPDRITSRIFWPLINMRIYYRSEGPHWVQRSKMLYRWTW